MNFDSREGRKGKIRDLPWRRGWQKSDQDGGEQAGETYRNWPPVTLKSRVLQMFLEMESFSLQRAPASSQQRQVTRVVSLDGNTPCVKNFLLLLRPRAVR